jgi:hypothetical protein
MSRWRKARDSGGLRSSAAAVSAAVHKGRPGTEKENENERLRKRLARPSGSPPGPRKMTGGGPVAQRDSRTHRSRDLPDPDLARRGYCLTVIGPVLLNVANGAGVLSGTALLLMLHLPSDSFGAVASKDTVALPLPFASANLPVLLDPSTV